MDDSIVTARIADYPELAAVVVLIVGIVAARLARHAVGFLLGALDRRLARYATSSASIVSPELVAFSKGLAFWLVVLAAVTFALRLLEVGALSDVLNTVISFIPQMFIGFTIIGAGHLLGLFLRGLTARLADTIGPDSLGPRLVHGAVLLIAIVMGLQHMSIDITFVTQLVLVLVVVVLGGLALAFALGARQHVANLLARSELARFEPGDRIRVDDEEGMIVDIHQTGVELTTAEGSAFIPASHFASMRVVRLPGKLDDE
jgi:uncharacterized protein YacL